MILVLLYKFSESPDSLLGFQLCLQLVKQGHDLYVTTTSTVRRLESEIAKAKELTMNYPGSITVLSAQCSDSDQSSPEWITNYQRSYFSYISKLSDINSIIGLLPGTAKTAVDLKKMLNCKLVLLATTKVGDHEEDLKEELSRTMKDADQIWSVEPNLYAHFEQLRKSSDGEHMNVLLKPFTSSEYYWQHGTSKLQIYRSGIKKFISIWSSGYLNFYKAKRFICNHSSIECFATLSAVLGTINQTKLYKNKIQWNVHGLKYKEPIQNTIKSHAGPNAIKLSGLKEVVSVDELVWKGCQAFLVPDTEDETFNFIALGALWLGVPTLVSNMSSVGRFLLNTDCPSKTKAVVILFGNADADREAWVDKIYKHILNENANPKEWAKELSDYLHLNSHLWTINEAVFSPNYQVKERRLSVDTTVSHPTAHKKQPGPDVIMRVQPWLRATEEAKHDPVHIDYLLIIFS